MGFVKLFVGIYIVWIEVIEFFFVEVICFCNLFIFVLRVGWYFIVEGIFFKRVDILELVCINLKILLINSSMFCLLIFWKYFVIVKVERLICILVFGGLFIWL